MKKYSGTTRINVGIEYASKQIDDFPVSRHEAYSFDLSGLRGINKDGFQKILADHKKLGSILQNSPKEFIEIMDDVLAGRHETAKGIARSVGLTEEDFQQESGGVAWWIIAAVVIVILTSCPGEAR